jgi:DNA invertase Pin-like site-specific DNA recombinase
MARRGTPLPIALRQEIKERSKSGETPTAIARALQLSRVTVYKFARQVCTPPICKSNDPR